MTTKSDFTAEQWQLILEAPPSAGMIVVTAQRGGSFRETIAMAKAYAEARQEHGKSELLDDIVAAKPERDHTHYHSFEELKQSGLQHLRDSVAVLQSKATPDEVDEYRKFIVTLSQKVAHAHREHGQEVSEAEQLALNDITDALHATAS
jgi:head-tail adaptor